MTLTKEDSVAVHEAGHAVLAALLGKIINFVTIVPKGISAGECNSDFKEDVRNDSSIRALDFKAAV